MSSLISLKLDTKFIDKIIPYLTTFNYPTLYPSLNYNKNSKNNKQSFKTSIYSQNLSSIFENDFYPIIQEKLKSLNNSFYSIKNNFDIYNIIQYENEGFLEIPKFNENDFTVLIGLDKSRSYQSGNIILWLPIENDHEFLTLIQSDDYNALHNLFRKYNIPFYNHANLFEVKKQILDYNQHNKYLPKYYKTLDEGEVLIFPSNIMFSGEPFFLFENSKKYVMFTLNISSQTQEEIDKLFYFMTNIDDNTIDLINKNDYIPFQIILNEGDYNNKTFKDYYLRFFNFNDNVELNDNSIEDNLKTILQNIFEKTKTKLNTRYRETLISSIVLEKSLYSLINHKKFIYKSADILPIKNYFLNFDSLIKEGYLQSINYQEKIKNLWEENEGYDRFDADDTYLNSKIKVYYMYYKNKKK